MSNPVCRLTAGEAAVAVGRKLAGLRGMMFRWIVETLIIEFLENVVFFFDTGIGLARCI